MQFNQLNHIKIGELDEIIYSFSYNGQPHKIIYKIKDKDTNSIIITSKLPSTPSYRFLNNIILVKKKKGLILEQEGYKKMIFIKVLTE